MKGKGGGAGSFAMESMGTQTEWSWVQDAAEIKRLVELHGSKTTLSIKCISTVDFKPGVGNLTQQDTHSSDHSAHTLPQTVPVKREGQVLLQTGIESEGSNALASSDQDANTTSRSINLPPISRLSIMSHDVTHSPNVSESAGCKDGNGVTLPVISGKHVSCNITDSVSESPADCRDKDETTLLPSISQHANTTSRNAVKTESNGSSATANQSSIFQQLELAICSEDENSDSSNNETSSGEEGDGEATDDSDDNEEMAKQPNMPDLEGVTDLPLPTILHYMRESESMASRYFSLQNRAEVDRRTEEVKLGAHHSNSEDNSIIKMATACQDEDETSGGTRDRAQEEVNGELPKVEEEGGSVLVCHFCGKSLPRRTLLADAHDLDRIKEEDYFCCAEYKRYTILVAVCMRQMVEKLRTAPPEKIPITVHRKISDTAMMEAKALAILRRKQKWEEIRRRREMQAEARRMVKGTKTIKFTLESPGEQEKSWTVRPKSGSSHRKHAKQKRAAAKKKKTEEKISTFPSETLDRLKQNTTSLSILERRLYTDGSSCCTILPDRTGFCNYPSGHRAVVIFALYDGVLAYLVYEDSEYPQLLACVDEMGRSCCYDVDHGRVRFLCTPGLHMVQFDTSGNTQRRIKCPAEGAGSPPHFQPISIPLNKYITIKCNPESTSIMLTFPHNHIKFTASSKLINDEAPAYSKGLISSTQDMEDHLTTAKTQISQLLHILQNFSQLQKLSKLESVYGRSAVGKGSRISNPARKDVDRKRTRSTGAIKVKKTANEKHSKAMTLKS